MCEKPECPHKGDAMCSCKAVGSWYSDEMKRHLMENMRDLKGELSYNSLSAPFPYRFCVSGVCKVCAGRMCVGVELPDYLHGEGFLAVAYYHMKHLHMDAPDQFVGLFHEEDHPYVRRWLERKDTPPERPNAVTIYTIVQIGVDMDRADFSDPAARGSYLSLRSARERLAELIAEEKADLDSRYDTERSEEDWWEIYQDGYESGCFRRLEILPSVLEKEVPRHE